MRSNEIVIDPAFMLIGLRLPDGTIAIYAARGKDFNGPVALRYERDYADVESWGGCRSIVQAGGEYSIDVRLKSLVVQTEQGPGATFASALRNLFGRKK